MIGLSVTAHAVKSEVIVGCTDDTNGIMSGLSQVRLTFVLGSGATISVWATLDKENFRRDDAFFFVGRTCDEPFTRCTGYFNPATDRGFLNFVPELA